MEDFFPSSDNPNVKTQDVICTIVKSRDGLAYADLPGRFPYKSSQNNEYMMVVYHYDSNSINVTPLKNREAKTLAAGWEVLHKRFERAGLKPNLYVLDNECSAEIKSAFDKYSVAFQRDKPYLHRANAAERAIQTFKNHMKAVLASLDPKFPVREWDRLLPQIELTLNLLRASRINPKLSAYAILHGQFDYNKTPLVPMGTKVVAHLKPEIRNSWSANGEEGWTIGPSLEHYRCVKCYFPHTRSEKDVDTVSFFPHEIKFPTVGLDDYLKQAAEDIIAILTSPPTKMSFSLENGDPTRNALLKIAESLHTAKSIPKTLDKPPRVSQEQPLSSTSKQQLPVKKSSPRVLVNDNAISKYDDYALKNKRSFYRPSTTHQYNLRNRNIRQPLLQNVTCFKTIAVQYLSACEKISPYLNHIYNKDGKKQSLDKLLRSDMKDVWGRALSNEWGRLATGNTHGVESTDTIEFIPHSLVPSNKKVTYASFVCDYRPLKKEQWRIRLVVGGDKLEYTLDSGSPATDLTETKILLNSVISDSDQGARFCSMDLKDMFLHTPMHDPEYMKVKLQYFPDDIIQRYNLASLVHSDGHIYIKIKKGMYGLKQAAVLAYMNLSKILREAGYMPIVNSQGMWKHQTRRTLFCLCVDDFGVKYYTKDDALHLQRTLEKCYTCNVDWSGQNYLGLTLEWNFVKRYVDISMPHYVEHALERLQYKVDKYPQFSPHPYVAINYTNQRDAQYATKEDDSPLLLPKDTKYIQSVVGSFLYYARAIDNTMLPALSQIAHQQSSPTVTTKKKCQQLMDYANTYKHAKIRFYASDMVLEVDSDAAYLVMPKARSRYAGYFRLLDDQQKVNRSVHNGAILIECKTIKNVVTSAAEAETKGVFNNDKTAVGIRNLLIQMNHPQPITHIYTDNSTAAGFINKNIQLKHSKAWDMNLHWLRNQEQRSHFQVKLKKGKNILADYYTKNHAISHHRQMRPFYVRDVINVLFSNLKYIKKCRK